jgi:hypothetical protein
VQWLRDESCPITKGQIAFALSKLVDEDSARTIWGAVRSCLPRLEYQGPILTKLHQSGWVGNEVADYLVALEESGEMIGSDKKLAETLGVLPIQEKNAGTGEAWAARTTGTKEEVVPRNEEIDKSVLADIAQGEARLREIWSTEVCIEDLPVTLEKLEANYRIRIHAGRDLPKLLKRRGEEGIFVAVDVISGSSLGEPSLYCCLEDEDTVLLRLITSSRPTVANHAEVNS